ncbi:MAG: hypothetical protein IT384_32630 [Deltaproteobacteria bacterium]|nr:hypothetical protein [Deltaproteobacteria bacterium]
MRLVRCLALSSVLPLVAGCDLFEAVSSTLIVSGLVVGTPELTLQGYFAVPAETAATAWVGERASETSTDEPTPISGVPVTVTAAGRALTLKELAGQKGVYAVSSLEDAALVYQAGATYVFDAEIEGEKHGGQGDAPPKLEAGAVTFTPALTANTTIPAIKTHQRNTSLTVTWGEQYGRYAYVSVFRADPNNPQQPELVFDTRPKSAKEVLDFVIGSPPTSVEVPPNTFDRDGVYALVLVAANKGGPRTNTFIGSPYLVGSATAELFAIGIP